MILGSPSSSCCGGVENRTKRTSSRGATEGTVDLARIERAVREILLAVGEDPDREGLVETPARAAKAYATIFAGLSQSPEKHLGRVFHERTDDVVICRNIEFYSMCEHHLLPFFGKAHVAYRPDGQEVVGLSKLARTVEVYDVPAAQGRAGGDRVRASVHEDAWREQAARRHGHHRRTWLLC
jgi:GTP cyclohydrolase I